MTHRALNTEREACTLVKRRGSGAGKGGLSAFMTVKGTVMCDTENSHSISGKVEETGKMREDWLKLGK